jgi:hypothetical protein
MEQLFTARRKTERRDRDSEGGQRGEIEEIARGDRDTGGVRGTVSVSFLLFAAGTPARAEDILFV